MSKEAKPEVSVIIKTLNEEVMIEKCITSALDATARFKAEIILADSLSTDKTIMIAKKFPIRIVRLRHSHDRCCGVGPQLGYQFSRGDYVYILDGDMVMDKQFIVKAVAWLKSHPKYAGVGGFVSEMRAKNMVFKRRKDNERKVDRDVPRLEMGGLYRRSALVEVSYFSNRNLHAYEEAELGYRLEKKGWKLRRLSIPGVEHYGYNTTSFGTFLKRWTTGYVKGSGEFLRSSLGTTYWWSVVWHLKIYLLVLTWWVLFLFALIGLTKTTLFITVWLSISLIFFFLFLIKKKNIKDVIFSFISWHFSAVGLIRGFFSRLVPPTKPIPAEVIQ